MRINEDIVKGKWHEVAGQAKEKWSKLTGDELLRVEGDCEKLAGLLQQSYGYSKEKAKEEVNRFIDSL